MRVIITGTPIIGKGMIGMLNRRFYKMTIDGIVQCVGFGYGGEEVAEEEYQTLRAEILSRPAPADNDDVDDATALAELREVLT